MGEARASEPLGRSVSGGPERASFLSEALREEPRAKRLLRRARRGKNLLSDGFGGTDPPIGPTPKAKGEIVTRERRRKLCYIGWSDPDMRPSRAIQDGNRPRNRHRRLPNPVAAKSAAHVLPRLYGAWWYARNAAASVSLSLRSAGRNEAAIAAPGQKISPVRPTESARDAPLRREITACRFRASNRYPSAPNRPWPGPWAWPEWRRSEEKPARSRVSWTMEQYL